jgi:glutamate 5-kinase
MMAAKRSAKGESRSYQCWGHRVSGESISGDTVELVSEQGTVIARGLVAFDSAEIPQMLGRSTKELAATLGAEYERELVHRDDLVLL